MTYVPGAKFVYDVYGKAILGTVISTKGRLVILNDSSGEEFIVSGEGLTTVKDARPILERRINELERVYRQTSPLQ